MAYSTIEIEGGMFSPDLLDAIASGDETEGQRPVDFGFDRNRRITDEIQSSFSDARSYWDSFTRKMARSSLTSVSLTREDWMKPVFEGLLGFPELSYRAEALKAGGQEFAISHPIEMEGNYLPIHIADYENPIDRRTGRVRRSPHASVQEFLNRSDAVWGVVSNGKKLRLLRDTVRISKPTYLEFDLQGMVESNQYSEFSLFYRLIHASRFPKDLANQNECLLETYYQKGIDDGTRIREKLRVGVENALSILGNAFITHPGSQVLRDELESGRLEEMDYYRQLLKLIYRLLFLMVSEERKLIYPESNAGSSRHGIYQRYYSVDKLRQRADRYFYGDENTDLWQGLVSTFSLFRDDQTASRMGLSALNGDLFGPNACNLLEASQCSNHDLLRGLRSLSVFEGETGAIHRVNYAGLDVEELGSVYESLLELQPVVNLNPAGFAFGGSGERKQTGSYYTPPELVRELINSALVPVIDDRVSKAKDKEAKVKALLDLRVCDPASGSGHFMLAAARRIARELAIVREGESEPTPTVYREALRDVIRSCIYAVDKNPLAVDLCKVALWIEGHNPGLPLSFLDNHIKCGDSLVGVLDLGVLDEGIPDDAYKPVEGDDKGAATAYRKQNERERKGQRQLALGESGEAVVVSTSIAEDFRALGDIADGTAEDVNAKEELYDDLRAEGSDWWKLKVACDLWTSAFFMPLEQEDAFHMEGVPTSGTLRRYLKTDELNSNLLLDVEKTSEAQSFFHWKLEFPDIFDQGGFDVVLGNPPWERIKLQEQEFFASRDKEISEAPNAAVRGRLIRALPESNPRLASEFVQVLHDAEATSKFIRGSGRVPLTGRGDINTFSIFAETMRTIFSPMGRVGAIVPSGIATDDTTKYFFADLVEKKSMVSLFDFENREKLFPSVDSRMKFCLLTLTGTEHPSEQAEFAFFLLNVEHLNEPERRFQLTPSDFAMINPNTRTCPIFRTRRDAEITK